MRNEGVTEGQKYAVESTYGKGRMMAVYERKAKNPLVPQVPEMSFLQGA